MEATPKRVPDPNHKRILELEAKIKRLTEALERHKKERAKDQALIAKLEAEIKELKEALELHEQQKKQQVCPASLVVC